MLNGIIKRGKIASSDDHRQFSRATDQQDGRFRRVDNRRRISAANGAQIADRKRAAAQVFDGKLVGRGSFLPFRQVVGRFPGIDRLSALRSDGTTKPTFGVDGDSDVDVFLVDDLSGIHVNRRVDDRMISQCHGNGLDHKRHRSQLDAAGRVIVLAGLANVLQVGDVGVVKIGNAWNGRPAAVHLFGNRPSHPRQFFIRGLDRMPSLTAPSDLRPLLRVDRNEQRSIYLRWNPATFSRSADGSEIDSQFTGESPHGRTGSEFRSRVFRRPFAEGRVGSRFIGGLRRQAPSLAAGDAARLGRRTTVAMRLSPVSPEEQEEQVSVLRRRRRGSGSFAAVWVPRSGASAAASVASSVNINWPTLTVSPSET